MESSRPTNLSPNFRPRSFPMFTTVVAVAGAFALLSPSLALAAGARFGGLSIVPYASVSSSKSIKPEKAAQQKGGTDAKSTNESVNQRTTYGLKINVRLFSFVALDVSGGMNKVDNTKKVSAIRDEFDEINIRKDFNLDTENQTADFRYQEEQRLANAKILLQPRLGQVLTLKAGAGVRARQRIITISDKLDPTKSTKKTDPIRYHALATAGAAVRLFGAASAHAEYNFYFIKFPETEPHEQEVLIGFGVSI